MESPTPSETGALEKYYRVAATDMSLVSDLWPQGDLFSSKYVKKFEQGGDRIFCETIDGGALWGVRLGPSTNPVIRLRPGRTIKKRFRYFTLISAQPRPIDSTPGEAQGCLQETQIELYVSTGDLIVDAPRDWGKGFGGRSIGRTDCFVDTTPKLIIDDFNKPFGFPNSLTISQWKPGRHGATLLLRNNDRGMTEIFIGNKSGQALGTNLNDLYRLFPGESLTMDLDSSIQQSFSQQRLIGDPIDVGFVVYTKGGSTTYDWMLSRLDCDPAPATPHKWEDTGLNLG